MSLLSGPGPKLLQAADIEGLYLGQGPQSGEPAGHGMPPALEEPFQLSGPSPAMISVRRRVSSVSLSSVLLGSTKNSYSVSTPVAFR